LCDDLPALIRWRETDMPLDVRTAVTKHTRALDTGWLDTHPSDADRIASARRENTAGVFMLDAPASVLFHDFCDLSRRATVAFYHQQLEGMVRPENLVGTDQLVAERGQKREKLQSLRRYFQDLVHPVRPIFPERIISGVTNHSAAAEMLLDLRTQFVTAAPDARRAADVFAETDAELVSIARVTALRHACVKKIDPKLFNLGSVEEPALRAMAHDASVRREAAMNTLTQVLTIGLQRMELALSLNLPRPATALEQSADEDFGEYSVTEPPKPGSDDRLADAMRCLSSVAPLVEDVRQQYYLMGTLFSQCKPESNPDELVGAVIAASRKLSNSMSQIHATLAPIPYPYEHVERHVTLAGYAMNQVPPPEAVGDVYSTADAMLEAIYSLYMRILSDMAGHAEEMEKSLGLDPLPEPIDEEEPEPQVAG
jgi:hypothetical protein